MIRWHEDTTEYISFPFSWEFYQWTQEYQPSCIYNRTIIGGGAVTISPDWTPPGVEIGEPIPGAYKKHSPLFTRTTEGCIRRCGFCAVPKIEGEFRELAEWEAKPLVIDNNILASSKKHFDKVIDSLKEIKNIDFNQGLDARLLTKYHAERLAEIGAKSRLAFDSIAYEKDFLRAYQILRDAGIPKRLISVYVLIGFKDNPEDALNRLTTVNNLGIKPFPMRYQPIDTKKKNSFISENWTHKELQRYVRYWSNLRYVGSVPFADWERKEAGK